MLRILGPPNRTSGVFATNCKAAGPPASAGTRLFIGKTEAWKRNSPDAILRWAAPETRGKQGRIGSPSRLMAAPSDGAFDLSGLRA